MSADTLIEDPLTKIFTKIEKSSAPSLALRSTPETIKKVHKDLERRLGPRKIKSQFDLADIKQVAEIVDELLEKGIKMTSAESRVAPAPGAHPPKRQQLYEHSSALPRIPSGSTIAHRNGSFQSEDHLRGIYTLPSSDPENPPRKSSPGKAATLENPYFSGKFVANLLGLLQIAFILLFAIFSCYEEENVNAIAKSYTEGQMQKPTERPNYDNNFYNPNNNNNYDRERNMYNREDDRYGAGSQNLPTAIPPPALQVQAPTQNLHKYYYCKSS